MGSSTNPTIKINNVVVTIKGKKYKLNLSIPLTQIVKALEKEGYLLFKTVKLEGSDTELLKRITTSR